MIRLVSIILVMFVGFVSSAVYAVEISPSIGFRQYSAPNGSEFDPNNNYQIQTQNDRLAMNKEIPMGKLVPDINSVGLDFTFKVD